MARAAGESRGIPLPCIQWPGSKARLAVRIASVMRPHSAYVEPFAGSLSVLLAKPSVPVEVVNDANGLLITFYKVLRGETTRLALIEAIMHTPYARDELKHAIDETGLDDVERVRRFFVRVNQAYVSSNGRGNWTATYQSSAGHSNASKWVRFQARLWGVAERLQGVQIEHADAFDILDRLGKQDDDRGVVYVDPPYLVRNGAQYEHDLPLEAHDRLAVTLNMLALSGRQVIVSGYDCPEYRDWYDGWHMIQFDGTKTGRPGTGSKSRVESLWVSQCRH